MGKIRSERSRLSSIINGEKGGKPVGVVSSATRTTQEARKWLSERVAEHMQPIFDVLLKKSLAGDINAIKELLDRAWGRPTQAVEMSGKDGNPMIFMPLELIKKHALTIEGDVVKTVPEAVIKPIEKLE